MTLSKTWVGMKVDLQYPNRILWPNGRTKSAAYKRRLQQEHKTWAFIAAGAGTKRLMQAPAKIHLLVSPKPRGPAPDKDGVISACKYYFDGISEATGLNDRYFEAPTVEFVERSKYGNIIIEVTQ